MPHVLEKTAIISIIMKHNNDSFFLKKMDKLLSVDRMTPLRRAVFEGND